MITFHRTLAGLALVAALVATVAVLLIPTQTLAAGDLPWQQISPVDADELAMAAQLLEDACQEPRFFVPLTIQGLESVDPLEVVTFRLVTKTITGCDPIKGAEHRLTQFLR